jgi:hypothetical protein
MLLALIWSPNFPFILCPSMIFASPGMPPPFTVLVSLASSFGKQGLPLENLYGVIGASLNSL